MDLMQTIKKVAEIDKKWGEGRRKKKKGYNNLVLIFSITSQKTQLKCTYSWGVASSGRLFSLWNDSKL